MASEGAKKTGDKPKTNEELIAEFQNLRNQQRNLVNSLNTLEMDLKEHKTVIDTLKTVEEDRKCFRLIGGVLCEQTVQVVLPNLITNKEFLEKQIELGKEQIAQKGQEINKFKDENNIKIKGQEPTTVDTSEEKAAEPSANRNVLVVNN